MSIDRLLRERVFDPESVTIMTVAYERARIALGLTNREDPMTCLVAQAVLSVVESGVRDTEQVFQLVLAALKTR